MKKNTRRVILHRETLRQLDRHQAEAVVQTRTACGGCTNNRACTVTCHRCTI